MNLEGTAHVKLYRFENQSNVWILKLTSTTTDAKITQRLSEDENTPGFLKFECFGSDGEMKGFILTAHIYLFDI